MMKGTFLIFALVFFLMVSNISASTIQLPKTGQTTSYWGGDDGDLEKGIAWPNPRFTVNGDCVTDNLTGLMWARNANLNNDVEIWFYALGFANNLSLCGYTDWRLPNRKELRSLIDYSKSSLPEGHPFTNVQDVYWTSTTISYKTDRAWVVDTRDGTMSDDIAKYINYLYIWPVRAGYSGGAVSLPKTGQTKCYNASCVEGSCTGTGQDGDIQAGIAWPDQRFTVDGDCVTDNLTGLIWARNANLLSTTPQQALDYTKSLSLCGHQDWRLPNVNELESLVNSGESNSAAWLNTQGFINVVPGDYWSSTSVDGYYWWCVNMWVGYLYHSGNSSNFWVLPVRAGQSGVFTDIPADFWAYDYVMALYNAGITTGYIDGTYRPSQNVSRSQMAAFIVRAKFGEDFSYSTTQHFSDMPDTHWAFKYVQKMYDEGITTGYPDGTFRSSQNVTRGQMATFIIKALFGDSFSYTLIPYFSDVPDTHWAFKYVQKMYDGGITTGYADGTCRPSQNVSRAQMAAFIARALLGME